MGIKEFKQRIKNHITLGGFFWHIAVFPQRFARHGFKLLIEPFKMRTMEKLVEPLKTRQFKKDHISIVITSAGRGDYLKKTVEALWRYIEYDPQKISWLIIDDYPDSTETREYIKSLDFFECRIFNQKNQGLGYSLNRIFSEIQTEFVFYCQEDFELLVPVLLQEMIDVMRESKHISQLMLSGEKELIGTKRVADRYREYEKMFGFWPFLASMETLKQFLPFPLYFTNVEFSFKVHKKGWPVSGIFGREGEIYVRHIGEERKVWVVK